VLAEVYIEFASRKWRAQLGQARDLSLPLSFDAQQPKFFGAPLAHAKALSAGSFIGDVRLGGSCNCETYTLTPHCNGTHTECVGHITQDRFSVRDAAVEALLPAHLVTVTPIDAGQTTESSLPPPQAADRLITRDGLLHAMGSRSFHGCSALIVRTLPNGIDKRTRDYDSGEPPAYFTLEAVRWLVAIGVRHLVVDLPSIDRAQDAGKLAAHRLFWGVEADSSVPNASSRRQATITELAYIEESILDGVYLLNLQVAPFAADVAPSRPVIYPLVPA
jgi:kynurenine formamidase